MSRFKDLIQKDKDYISSVYLSEISHEEKIEILSKKYKVTGRTVRRWAKEKLGLSSDNKLTPQLLYGRNRLIPKDTDIILFTSAQNKTIPNNQVLKSIITYKDFLESKGKKVEIVVAPFRYRNPTSSREYNEKTISEEWWDDSFTPYIYYGDVEFNGAMLYTDMPVVPTASNPLDGLEYLASNHHAIIPHNRIHFKTLPRFYGDNLKSLSTSGCCTVKNYSHSKAGKKGYFHHSYGFSIIEKISEGNCTVPRNVKVNSDGTFTDIIWEVKDGIVNKIQTCKGYVLGDIHHAELDLKKDKISKEICNIVNPENIIFHDLLDAGTINPHEVKDNYIKKQRIKKGKYLIEEEVNNAIKYLESWNLESNYLVVQSNHDDFLDRYVNNFNWKLDIHNSDGYLKYAMIQQQKDLKEYGNIFGYLLSKESKAKYIPNHKGLVLESYQCGHHGDYGVNGSRGSIKSFKRLNFKMIHGHNHSPQVLDNVTCVGVSCNLWQYYNSNGLSSWALGDSIIHNTGKNQLLVFNDEYILSTLLDI